MAENAHLVVLHATNPTSHSASPQRVAAVGWWQRWVGDSSKVTRPSTDLGITAEKMAVMVSQLSQNSSLSTGWVSSGTLLFSLRGHTRMAETRWALCCLSLSFQSPAGLSGHQAVSPTTLVHTWWKKGL